VAAIYKAGKKDKTGLNIGILPISRRLVAALKYMSGKLSRIAGSRQACF
jgi:hypothetical protein